HQTSLAGSTLSPPMSTEKPNHGKRTPAGRIGNLAKNRGLAGLITKAGTAAATTLGKLPPQATDLEEAVLGALMLEKDALTTVIEILTPESFYKDSHKEIYKAITEL